MSGLRCALVFMAKWPEPGKAKTRLCPPLTHRQAADLARCFLLDTLDAAAGTGCDRFLAYAPAETGPLLRELVGPDVGLIVAEGANLGIALASAQERAFAMGYHAVALVASDIPHLPGQRYAEALAALQQAAVGLGPSADGGYYLLISRRPTPALFENITWSTEVVFEQTVARAAAAGLSIAMLPPCDDADTAADLPRLTAALTELDRPTRSLTALLRLGERREPGTSDQFAAVTYSLRSS